MTSCRDADEPAPLVDEEQGTVDHTIVSYGSLLLSLRFHFHFFSPILIPATKLISTYPSERSSVFTSRNRILIISQFYALFFI